jgi:hypothetical protein
VDRPQSSGFREATHRDAEENARHCARCDPRDLADVIALHGLAGDVLGRFIASGRPSLADCRALLCAAMAGGFAAAATALAGGVVWVASLRPDTRN